MTRAKARRDFAFRPRGKRPEDEEDALPAASPSGIVAIVGRPNVGKSTLYNRITGTREAIVAELSGLTRDRLYGVAEWQGRVFTIVDTAGLQVETDAEDAGLRELLRGTQTQAHLALDDADVIIFVVDARSGAMGADQDVAEILRSRRKPMLLVANKADDPTNAQYSADFFRFGMGEPLLISALNGKEVGELLDRVVELLPPPSDQAEAAGEMRIAIAGRPNVGKSSLLNALAGKERALVSPIPGTTRDATDTLVSYEGRKIRLVDTAGIRRQGLIGTDVEHYSLLRSMRAIERSDVVLLVMDADQGASAQDRHVAGYAVDSGKGVVIVANKWDLLDREIREDPVTLKTLRTAFRFIPDTPLVTCSALERRNLLKVLEKAIEVGDARNVRMPTTELNNLVRNAMDSRPPRFDKGRQFKVKYATQSGGTNPTVVLFANDPKLLYPSYERYLENSIRSHFGFTGTRIRIIARAGDERE